MLRLGIEVRLGNFSGGVSGPPRHRDLRLGEALCLGVHSYA